MNWFFSSPASVKLILTPTMNGKPVAGFLSGAPLTCVATSGETIGTILSRFNVYRGPDQQLTEVWSAMRAVGQPVPLTTVIKADTVVYIRG
jgi:hypothetical protein